MDKCECGGQAMLQCECMTPLKMCAQCTARHVFDTPGQHQQRIVGATSCTACGRQPSSCLCSCQKVGLCEGCFVSHQDSSKHFRLPLLEGRDSGRFLSLAQVLLESVDSVRMAQQVVVTALNEQIRSIQAYKVNLLRSTSEDVGKLERFVNDAIRELTMHFQQRSGMLRPDLDVLLSMTPEEQREKLHFATVMKGSSEAVSKAVSKAVNLLVSKNLSVMTTNPEPIKLIPMLELNKALVAPEPFTSAYEVSIEGLNLLQNFTAWCFLENGNVFATGIQNDCTSLVIDFTASLAIPLSDTLEVHGMPGLLPVGERIFLFGGLWSGGSSATCEVHDLYENAWWYLPDMLTPRSHFQPCRYRQFIYIFGGMETDRAERFSLEQFSFEPLKLVVPGRHWITTYCHGDTFYFFTKTQILLWDQRSPPKMWKEGLSVGFFSQMSPVRIGEEIYFYGQNSNNRCLLKMNLRSTRFDIILQFEQTSSSN